jgi:hypothetical protein
MPLRKALSEILSSDTGALSPRMVGLIADLAQDWRRLDERIAAVSAEIEALAEPNAASRSGPTETTTTWMLRRSLLLDPTVGGDLFVLQWDSRSNPLTDPFSSAKQQRPNGGLNPCPCPFLRRSSGLSNGFLLRGLQVRILLGSPMISMG